MKLPSMNSNTRSSSNITNNITDTDERLINVKWNIQKDKKYPSDILVYTNTYDNLLDIITKASSNNMIIDSNSYKGNKNFEDNDEFKAPMIDFNVKREYDELSNKIFTSKDGKEYVIDTAIQTISFSLDEKGGKIKSEAATDVKTTAMPNMNEPRYFNIDNTFALFLKEESKDKPYFAARIENIKKYQ